MSLVEGRVLLHQPGVFVVEVCAAIARRTRNRALAMAAGEAALAMPDLTPHSLNHRLAAEAADVAATCALRGAGATLLTLDAEVRDRAAGLATVRTPSELSVAMW